MGKTCSFFGHRTIAGDTTALRNAVESIVLELIADGYDTFCFGGFGDFDDLCHMAVSKVKTIYPNITRIYCLSDVRHTRADKRPSYLSKEDYEQFVYLTLDYDYWYTRIYYRNCEMINQSNCIVFYVTQQQGGAYKSYMYAKRKHKEIILLDNNTHANT